MSDDPGQPRRTPFDGFEPPVNNFYRLPNSWFDLWARVREATGRDRIVSLLKSAEYLAKHTWGYQRFDQPLRLSLDEFERGRCRRDRSRLDAGTGLAHRHVLQAVKTLEDLGLVETLRDDADAARKLRYYTLRIAQPASDAPLEPAGSFVGFDNPRRNYFEVPMLWSELWRTLRSAVEILTVEYFFRHMWGWQGDVDSKWMTVDEVANGRQYKTKPERYDGGIGFPVDNVRRACERGVELGLLVWRVKRVKQREVREYALRMAGMSPGQQAVAQPPQSVGKPTDAREPLGDARESQGDASEGDAREPLADAEEPQGDEREPLTDVGEPAPDAGEPRSELNTFYPDTEGKTPQPPDTTPRSSRHGRATAAGGGGRTSLSAYLAVHADVLTVLQEIGIEEPVCTELAQLDLTAQAVQAHWAQLARDARVQDARSVLVYRLRHGWPAPGEQDATNQTDLAMDRDRTARWQSDIGLV